MPSLVCGVHRMLYILTLIHATTCHGKVKLMHRSLLSLPPAVLGGHVALLWRRCWAYPARATQESDQDPPTLQVCDWSRAG